MRSLLLGLALAVGLLGPAQAAITFNFSWSGSGGGGSFSATGVMTINKAAGETFTASDITGTSITVTSSSLGSFIGTNWSSGGGSIAGDGLSAAFSASSTPYLRDSGNFRSFGCAADQCSSSSLVLIFGGTPLFVNYGSPSAAVASMKLTAVPLPAALPMAAVAFGGLAALFRRRRGAAGPGRA